MLKKIMFKEEAGKEYTYNGRNGHSKCRGLELLTADSSDHVSLIPVNSRGAASSTFIEIPKDPEVLRELAKSFQQFAAEIDPCRTQVVFSKEDVVGLRPHWSEEMQTDFFDRYASSLKDGLVHDGNERLMVYLSDFERENGKCQAELTISPKDAQEAKELLTMTEAVITDAGRDKKLLEVVVDFGDNVEAVLSITNSKSGPYLDAVLFDSGNEADCLDPCFEELVGTYVWETKYNTYELTVRIAES